MCPALQESFGILIYLFNVLFSSSVRIPSGHKMRKCLNVQEYRALSCTPLSDSNETAVIQTPSFIHKNDSDQRRPGVRGMWTIIPKCSAWEAPWVMLPLSWMKQLFFWLGVFQWIKKTKWHLASPITILFVSEKMGRGSWRLFADR